VLGRGSYLCVPEDSLASKACLKAEHSLKLSPSCFAEWDHAQAVQIVNTTAEGIKQLSSLGG
jgi:hypothetical protein